MSTRVLDWNGLLRVADRADPEARVIAVAGVPARLKKRPRVDPGFSARSLDEDVVDEAWELRGEQLRLLRVLVDAGQVTVDDDEDIWRHAEWGALLADRARGCFVSGCKATADDIDIRGPVFDDRDRMHKACTPHREGLMRVLGEQHPAGTVDLDEGNH